MGEHAALEIVDLHKSYGSVQVLKGITITANQGEFISLVGPSGCGKTTTLNIVGGFEKPNSGDVRLNGSSVVPLPSYKRGLGMVFQNHALFPHMTILENVGFGLKMRGTPKAEIADRARASLQMVRLDGFENRYPRELSGGQQQRVGIARALTVQPKVLLMDEPLSSLDAKLRREMHVELRSIQQQVGITALYVTHDQEEALSLSDRIVLMNKGRVEQNDTPQQLYTKPASEFVASFIGETSFFNGRLREIRGQEAIVDIAGGGEIIVNSPGNISAGENVRIAIRPDRLRILDQATSAIQGTVVASAYAGSLVRLVVRLSDKTEIHISVDANETIPEIGSNICAGSSVSDWLVYPKGDEL